ncbi:MAG: ornithine carbamoyltransferase [Clostridia bacterium]|jgi:ornithine carbamoyltransferase|nr:Ornithine carbamoyltransferase [Clostridiales bacterium]MDK2985250.1 ornithine carbamoyltransferase [Clostridia bacterium]
MVKEALKGRDFLSVNDVTNEEFEFLMDYGIELKKQQKSGCCEPILKGKTLGMIFHKSSTRTRVSFEVGMVQLGGYPLVLNANELQLGRGETIADTAMVLSRYIDGIMIRTYSHASVEELAEYADIPVINGLTDLLHPCQILADLMTVKEHKGELKGLKMAYVGDGNNIANSLLNGCTKVGMDLAVVTPPGYEPNAKIYETALKIASETGSKITLTTDIKEGVEGADVIYTDVWASMGQEAEREARIKIFKDYQVNSEVLKIAKPDVSVLHCLPAYREEEITSEVMDGPHSIIFDQAENRLHAQKALLACLL